MTLTLLLPWFPIILATAIGAHLMGRPRGLGLGILCSLFWVVLLQASSGTGLWADGWTVATVIAGSAAITAMGNWASRGTSPKDPKKSVTPAQFPESASGTSTEDRDFATMLSVTLDRFDDWFTDHVGDRDPWPAFDGFIRSVLYSSCRATHVRAFRLLHDGGQLEPLHASDPLIGKECIPARLGIRGHVLTSGRPHFRSETNDAPMVSDLAEQSDETIVWCFSIRMGTQRLGLVSVGSVDMSPKDARLRLSIMEQLISQFWRTLLLGARSESAVQIDSVTGLSTRSAFMTEAEDALSQSYKDGEPVAVAVLDLEGLRAINDSGRWESADELIRAVAKTVLGKLRADDVVGRYDGSRILLLLRRVDSELATLIINQVATKIQTQCPVDREKGTVRIRCGLAGSGTDTPDLRTLITRAMHQCRRARRSDVVLASDLHVPEPAGVAGS